MGYSEEDRLGCVQLDNRLIGKRIGEAIEIYAAKEKISEPKARAALATMLRTDPDTIKRWRDGITSAPATAVWFIGDKADKPFGWFADELESPAQRMARVAERLGRQITEIDGALGALRADLQTALEEIKASGISRAHDAERDRRIARASRRQGAQEGDESVAPPSDAAGGVA